MREEPRLPSILTMGDLSTKNHFIITNDQTDLAYSNPHDLPIHRYLFVLTFSKLLNKLDNNAKFTYTPDINIPIYMYLYIFTNLYPHKHILFIVLFAKHCHSLSTSVSRISFYCFNNALRQESPSPLYS